MMTEAVRKPFDSFERGFMRVCDGRVLVCIVLRTLRRREEGGREGWREEGGREEGGRESGREGGEERRGKEETVHLDVRSPIVIIIL